MVKQIDARGKACPLPVIEAKHALEAALDGTKIEVLVDNEIAVQNLCKMAAQKHYEASGTKVQENCYLVEILKGGAAGASSTDAAESASGRVYDTAEQTGSAADQAGREERQDSQNCGCQPMNSTEQGMVVVLASDKMGEKDSILGKILMKGFIYALTEQDRLPETILLYNGGAWLSCKGSDSLEDLKNLESQGVEILTCGTCLNHFGLSDKLEVGSVTNMYQIAQILTEARKVIKP